MSTLVNLIMAAILSWFSPNDSKAAIQTFEKPVETIIDHQSMPETIAYTIRFDQEEC